MNSPQPQRQPDDTRDGHPPEHASPNLSQMFVAAVRNAGDGAVSKDLIASILWGADKPRAWRGNLRTRAHHLQIRAFRVGGYRAYKLMGA